MKNKRNLKPLKLEKKTISNLNVKGGFSTLTTPTFQPGCITNPILCDPVSFPVDCFTLNITECPI